MDIPAVPARAQGITRLLAQPTAPPSTASRSRHPAPYTGPVPRIDHLTCADGVIPNFHRTYDDYWISLSRNIKIQVAPVPLPAHLACPREPLTPNPVPG